MSTYIVEFLSVDSKGEASVASAQQCATPTQLNECMLEGKRVDGFALVRPERCVLHETARSVLVAQAAAIDRYAVVCPLPVAGFHEAEDKLGGIAEVSLDLFPACDCALLRIDAFRRFNGLADAGEIGFALVEYALRLNGYGFSAITANRAWVEASTVDSPSPESLRLALKDSYPWLQNADILKESQWRRPFVEALLSTRGRKSKILFEYSDMMPWYCGTSEMQLAVLEYFNKHFRDKYEFCIRCNRDAMEFHKLRERFGNVYLPEEDMPLCDVGFVSAQPLTLGQQLFLNSHCLRIIYTMLDCILLRSGYLAEGDPSRADIVRSGLRYSDGIVFISNFSKKDCFAYYAADRLVCGKPCATVYLASDSPLDAKPEEGMPFDSFVLVAGNYLKHKALEDILRVVAHSERNYVFMGIDMPEGMECDNVRCYRSSFVSDEFLSALYDACDCVVFPSQYEGFGLPITIAWRHGKKVLVCENDLNRELYDFFEDMQPNMAFMTSFDEVEKGVDSLAGEPFVGSFESSWEESVLQIERFVSKVLEAEYDWAQTEERQWHYRTLESVNAAGVHSVGLKKLVSERYLDGHPVRNTVARGSYRAARSVMNLVRRRR